MPTSRGEAIRAAIVSILLLTAAAFGVYFLPISAYATWKPEYAQNSPETQTWFKTQRNARGEWCCSEADGHRYDGDYKINADGSVTVEGETIPKDKVLTGPNPTNAAVWWFLDGPGGRRTYCFAVGPLI